MPKPSTPEEFASFIDGLHKSLGQGCRSLEWHQAQRSEDDALVDWRHGRCRVPAQHVVARFLHTEYGVLTWQYARKTRMALDEQTIARWQDVFAQASVPAIEPPRVKVRIAGGEVVEIPQAKGDFLGARDGKCEVEAAAWVKIRGGHGDWLIADYLAVSFQEGVEPTSIRVEDVTSDPIVLLVDDPAPRLDARTWQAFAHQVPVDQAEAFHKKGDELSVLRFTIGFEDGPPTILYQGRVLSKAAKKAISRLK